MFTLGGTELLLLGVLVLLLFGPEKVPQLARTLGRAMREFNKYKDIMESAFRVEMQAAEKVASDDATDDSIDRLTKAAAASREYAAEQGAAAADEAQAQAAGEPAAEPVEGPAEQADGSATPLTVTDEDEEEGRA